MEFADLPVISKLPAIQLDKAMHASHARTICKIMGVALLVQWFIPLGNGAWMWDAMGFATIWALLGGIALTAAGFVQHEKLTPGVLVLLALGVGGIGLLSMGVGFASGMPGLPSLGFFGIFGMVAVIFGLMLWSRDGGSDIAYWIVVGGVGSMALSLLIPQGGEMPLIAMFKILGQDGMNIISRIFFFLFALLYIGVVVLTVLFVVLKRASVTAKTLNTIATITFAYLTLAPLVLGVFLMFSAGFLLLLMFHMSVILVAYVWLTLYGGTLVFDAAKNGGVKQLLS